MLVSSTQLSTCRGAVSSSSRNKYLYWLVGTSACRLVGGMQGRGGAEAEAGLSFIVGKGTGNPRVALLQPIPLPMTYLYPFQGYGFTCGLALRDP